MTMSNTVKLSDYLKENFNVNTTASIIVKKHNIPYTKIKNIIYVDFNVLPKIDEALSDKQYPEYIQFTNFLKSKYSLDNNYDIEKIKEKCKNLLEIKNKHLSFHRKDLKNINQIIKQFIHIKRIKENEKISENIFKLLNLKKSRINGYKYHSNTIITLTTYYKKNRVNKSITNDELDKIDDLYFLARTLRSIFGYEFDIDHEIPINGKYVSGLHTINNLRLMPKRVNIIKSNKTNELHGKIYYLKKDLRVFLNEEEELKIKKYFKHIFYNSVII